MNYGNLAQCRTQQVLRPAAGESPNSFDLDVLLDDRGKVATDWQESELAEPDSRSTMSELQGPQKRS